jgi:uncharacterized protein (DUF1697 family)
MAAIVSMLRGVNLGSHHKVSMEALRVLYTSLGLRDAQTYVQSGNVVFRTEARDLARLAKRIEDAVERSVGFRCDVILRTTAEMQDVIRRNPFAARSGIEPAKLLVDFLAREPSPEGREKVSQLKTNPEELRLDGREIYIYFPNGMGRSKLAWPALEKMLATPGTGRNWNTVRKLAEMAERLETSP